MVAAAGRGVRDAWAAGFVGAHDAHCGFGLGGLLLGAVCGGEGWAQVHQWRVDEDVLMIAIEGMFSVKGERWLHRYSLPWCLVLECFEGW